MFNYLIPNVEKYEVLTLWNFIFLFSFLMHEHISKLFYVDTFLFLKIPPLPQWQTLLHRKKRQVLMFESFMKTGFHGSG